MKKLIIIPLFFLFSEFKMARPVYEVQDVFTVNEIIYYGLDFSQLVITGSLNQFDGAGQVTPTNVRDKYFPGWNSVVINEAKKYNLAGAFRKASVPYDLSIVEKRNLLRDPETIFTNSSDRASLDYQAISKVISEYEFTRKEGIGLVFIMELFDKGLEKGVMHVTLFDIASKKVLITSRMTGRPGGIGIRNYWIKSVFDVIRQIENGEYKRWKMNYNGR